MGILHEDLHIYLIKKYFEEKLSQENKHFIHNKLLWISR